MMPKQYHDDDLLLVCSPVTSQHPVAGSITAHCGTCHQFVWLAPSSFPVMDRAHLICFPCAQHEVAKARQQGEPLKMGQPLPGQREEIERELKRVREQ